MNFYVFVSYVNTHTQESKSVFHVSPVKPNPLNNCTIKASLNQSSEILEVECVPGYDGGLRQEFRLEAYEVLTGNLRVNASSVSADAPIFRIAVADLLPATHFYLVTYAVNAKGRSEVSLLEDIMLRDSEKHTGKRSFQESCISLSCDSREMKRRR